MTERQHKMLEFALMLVDSFKDHPEYHVDVEWPEEAEKEADFYMFFYANDGTKASLMKCKWSEGEKVASIVI